MPSLRSNAPSSPGFLQWSAALRIRRFSALENCRRLAVAATSGSGAVEAADAAAAVALRAPCAAASAGTPATPCGNDPFNKLLMRYLPLLSKFAKGSVSHHIGTGGLRRRNGVIELCNACIGKDRFRAIFAIATDVRKWSADVFRKCRDNSATGREPAHTDPQWRR